MIIDHERKCKLLRHWQSVALPVDLVINSYFSLYLWLCTLISINSCVYRLVIIFRVHKWQLSFWANPILIDAKIAEMHVYVTDRQTDSFFSFSHIVEVFYLVTNTQLLCMNYQHSTPLSCLVGGCLQYTSLLLNVLRYLAQCTSIFTIWPKYWHWKQYSPFPI